ncbi:MAG: hypothetical protein AAGD07_04640 [Planctomycetota bacterium]
MNFRVIKSFLVVGVVLMASVPGCGSSSVPEVAPRSDAEVEAYKAEVYAAEEESDAEEEE